MISTFLLHSIQSMLNSCERLSATVTAKKVTLIPSTIVLLQGLPAGNTEQAQGVTERRRQGREGREGRRGEEGGGSVHLPASAPAVCRGGCHTHPLSPKWRQQLLGEGSN